MSWVLGEWERTQQAFKGAEFVFELPEIVTADGGHPQGVENAPPGTATGTAWDISLAGAPQGMGFNRTAARPKFTTITSGRLSAQALYWTPTTEECYLVEDGRQKRPRFWIITIQVTGRGRWEGRQWDFTITIEASDRQLSGKVVRDADSIAAHGIGREIPLPWYQHDKLDLAGARRYTEPPLVSEWTFPLTQPTIDHLRTVESLDCGDLVHLDPNGLGGLVAHTAMIVEVKYQFPPGGKGMGYKQIVTVERFGGDTIALEVRDVPLTVNGIALKVGG